MRPQTALSPDAPMIQDLARGVCPICTLTRAFQNAMIDAPLRFPARSLCNFHIWALAGSSPAVEATRIFRAMLEDAPSMPDTNELELRSCDWCKILRGHEEEKLAEFARELQRANVRNWVKQYGTVCLFHGKKVLAVLSQGDAELTGSVVANNILDLERQLDAFDAKVRRGERGGAGVLGFIAEFLVSQRGITR